MGFEAPLALLGLLAAAIPIIAHLVRRRDLPRVDLPTIALLERAQAQSKRRMRLVDLLLLIARILLVAMIALAVADPYFTVRLAYGDGRIASVAIVVDDSMSMGRDGLLEDAAERARSAIQSLPEGSEVAVVLAGKTPRLLVPRTTDLDAASEALERVTPTARGTAMTEAVVTATRELLGARHEARRLLIITDGAAHARLADVVWPEGDIGIDVVRVGDARGAPNRAVTAAMAVPDPTTPGAASISVEVRSFGAGDGAVPLSLRRGEETLEETTLELSGGVGRTVLHGPLVSEGDPSARVVVGGEDALAGDDARTVLLRPPTALRVLLVDGDPHPSRDRDELGFLVRALEMAPASGGAISHRVVDPDTLANTEVAGFDVVVLANVPTPSAVTADRLVEHVRRGGGLLVAAGDRVTPRPYAARLGDLLPARPSASGPLDPPLGIVRGEAAQIVAEGDTGLAQVSVAHRLLLEPSLAESRVELAFTDGAPALVTGTHGRGRTAILAIPVDDDWSDLPYRPGFLPLVVELLERLSARPEIPDDVVAPGETVTLTPPPGSTRLAVLRPDGERVDHEGSEPLRFERTELAGAYRVQVETETGALEDDSRSAFVVAPPVEESDLASAELPRFDQGREAGTSGAVVRRSMAPWLFLLAGLLAIAEALLRRHPWRRRA